MDKVSLDFLPFPYVYNGKRGDGATHEWPDRCKSCDRQCETSDEVEVGLCSYGVNFLRIDESLLIAGVVTRDDPRSTIARSKMLKQTGRNVVERSDLLAIKKRARQIDSSFRAEVSDQKTVILNEYRDSGAYKRDIVELLQPSLQQTFAQVHDYRQLVTQIVQNVNVILESTMPGNEIDAQLREAHPSLTAIYWAARLMEFKIDSALYLVYPERIKDPNKIRGFRLHGAVKKYLSIYSPVIGQKRLNLREDGLSYGNLMANPDAIGVIPHAFIDNAVKYASDGSTLSLVYNETEREIRLTVRSMGPKIAKDELPHLFELFYRGQAAKDSSEDGTGFGLGLAQFVADRVGAQLSVSQATDADANGLYSTDFVAVFPKPGDEERPSPLVRARKRTYGATRPV